MIVTENERRPSTLSFDFAIVAIGFERRCRWVVDTAGIKARHGIGLEFGFLAEGSYADNKIFFDSKNFETLDGIDPESDQYIADLILSKSTGDLSIFIDISSMSRLMIANVLEAIGRVGAHRNLNISVAYAPSRFSDDLSSAPIRMASPIKSSLAGWSAQPEQPLGVLMGLGAEPGLALGALQMLEPDKAWTFSPNGIDRRFDRAVRNANPHLSDIFEVTNSWYHIRRPALCRAKFEALLNAVDGYYRLVVVPFGPKIFAWTMMSTLVFGNRRSVGIWAFSSKEQANVVDREADGKIIWHNIVLSPQVPDQS